MKFKMIKFEAKEAVKLPRNKSDFISHSKVANIKIVTPNILLGKEEILYLTDSHMESEMERFGIHSSGTRKYLSNTGEKVTKLDEAVYLGSALDFLHYESVVYTLAKYEVFLKSLVNYSPKNIILNERMSKNTQDWLISSIGEKFPECQVILVDEKTVIEIETLCLFTLNDHLINSNLKNMCAFIKTLTPTSVNQAQYGSKILLARKEHVYFDLKSRKPRNSRIFEWYARSKGYEVFDPGTMKFEDVLERMAGASKIVSYHGGGLVNLLACKPGTQVSEIYSEWYADCFEQISASCNLDYESYFYEIKKRPDLIRTVYYLLFKLKKKAYIKHFRIKYRDFNTILSV